MKRYLFFIIQILLFFTTLYFSKNYIKDTELYIYVGNPIDSFQKELRTNDSFSFDYELKHYFIDYNIHGSKNVFAYDPGINTKTLLILINVLIFIFCPILLWAFNQDYIRIIEIFLLFSSSIHTVYLIRNVIPPSLRFNQVQVVMANKEYYNTIIDGPLRKTYDLVPDKKIRISATVKEKNNYSITINEIIDQKTIYDNKDIDIAKDEKQVFLNHEKEQKVIIDQKENIDPNFFYLSLSKYGTAVDNNIFSVSDDLVYCNVRVINCQNNTIVFHWDHKSSSHSHIYKYKMPLHAIDRWRTCSNKHFHGLSGKWNVSLYLNNINQSNLLGSIDFIVE